MPRSLKAVDEEKVLLTVEETAARLNLGRTSVFGLIKRGELASVQIGRSRRIPAHALEQYAERLLAEQCGGAARSSDGVRPSAGGLFVE